MNIYSIAGHRRFRKDSSLFFLTNLTMNIPCQQPFRGTIHLVELQTEFLRNEDSGGTAVAAGVTSVAAPRCQAVSGVRFYLQHLIL